MESNSERKIYSLYLRDFIDSDKSSLNHDFLRNPNFNENHNLNRGLSPIIPLQTPQENPGASKLLNSFQPLQSFPRNSAPEMSASSSKSVNLLQTSMENVSGSKDLGNFVPEQYSLLQNPEKQLYAGSDIGNQMQTPAENIGSSQLLNYFTPKQVYKGSDGGNHLSSPIQLFQNNANENLSGPKFPKKLPSEQLLKRPIENPKEDDPPSQTTSRAIDEIFSAKDDYSLSFLFQEGVKYCTVDANAMEQTTRNVSEEENSTGGLLIAEPSSEAINQRDKGSLEIIDLLQQNLLKCPGQRRKEGDGQPKRELQVANPGTPGHKENNPTYNKATPSLLGSALINRTDGNHWERSNTPLTSSVSPPTVTRGTGGPIRSRVRTFPVKLYGETSHGSSSNKRFDWNMRDGSISSAPLYHSASRLSRSSSALGSNGNWQTIPSGYNSDSETQKWQNLLGSSNVEGGGDQQLSSPFSGLHNQSFQTSASSLLAPTKETEKYAPLSATEIVANVLMKSTSQSQINSSTGQNQQPEQFLPVQPAQQSPEKVFNKPVPHQNSTSSLSPGCNIIPKSSANRSFFHEGQESDYGITESSNEPNPSGNSSAGNMVNSKLINAPVTFDSAECQKTKQVDHHAMENLGTEIDTSNFASLELGEKEFESMVNWPEHHLMGTDRFGFDV